MTCPCTYCGVRSTRSDPPAIVCAGVLADDGRPDCARSRVALGARIALAIAAARTAVNHGAWSFIANLDADLDKKASSILWQFFQSLNWRQRPKYIACGGTCGGRETQIVDRESAQRFRVKMRRGRTLGGLFSATCYS